MQSKPVLTLTVVATGAVPAHRFVSPQGALPQAGGNTLGVTRAEATAAGQEVAVDVLGTTVVEAGAAIAAGALLETDSQGRAVPRTSGQPVARALQAATGAGRRIEVLLLPN